MIHVLITTDSNRRGVFAGYVPDDFDFEKAIQTGIVSLSGMRNCIYWSKSVGGVFGLAINGPDSQCKIGAKVETVSHLNGVTYIAEMSDDASKAWENAPCVS